MGVRKTADFLEKATWTLAASLIVLCIFASITIPREHSNGKSAIEENVKNAVDPTSLPNIPNSAPAQKQNAAPQPAQQSGGKK